MRHATFEVFFDGDCPPCVREIGTLRWLDRLRLTRRCDHRGCAISRRALLGELALR
jgi:predicted DCC family thiol-disulfide oxidoreductase YuxK